MPVVIGVASDLVTFLHFLHQIGARFCDSVKSEKSSTTCELSNGNLIVVYQFILKVL